MDAVERCGAFDAGALAGRYDAVVAGFFFSRVKRARAADFVRSLANRVASGGLVILFDNNYVAGSNHPITRRDELGDTYQDRRLGDGTKFEVLKNFYTHTELIELAAPWTAQLDPLT